MEIIDVHTHGTPEVDTRTGRVEDILRIARAHGAAGVSTIVLSIYPAPPEEMRRAMAAVAGARKRQQAGGNPGCAEIAGVHLEGPFLNPDFCGALDRSACAPPDWDRFRALIEGYESIVRVVTVAPEREGACPFIRKAAASGIVVAMGHSGASWTEAEAGFRAGARGITHLFNAMAPFHHREPGIAGFGLMNREIYVEVIGDPFHLHERTLELIFRQKDPGRILLVSDCVRQPQAEDGGPHRKGVLQGGTMILGEAAARLKTLGFDPFVVEQAVSVNPARYLA